MRYPILVVLLLYDIASACDLLHVCTSLDLMCRASDRLRCGMSGLHVDAEDLRRWIEVDTIVYSDVEEYESVRMV
jgi:hypothetical protein